MLHDAGLLAVRQQCYALSHRAPLRSGHPLPRLITTPSPSPPPVVTFGERRVSFCMLVQTMCLSLCWIFSLLFFMFNDVCRFFVIGRSDAIQTKLPICQGCQTQFLSSHINFMVALIASRHSSVQLLYNLGPDGNIIQAGKYSPSQATPVPGGL